MKLLALNSSILGENSASHHLITHYLDYWHRAHPHGELIYRDLDTQSINHLSSTSLSRTDTNETAHAEHILHEFLNADELIIGAPMYNFSIPSQLKAWIDRVLVAGQTFKYTDQGVVGLAGDKRVTIISTRGNNYTNSTAMRALDHQEHYLQTIFNFIGITNYSVIRAEGLHLGEDVKVNAMTLAEQKIHSLFAQS